VSLENAKLALKEIGAKWTEDPDRHITFHMYHGCSNTWWSESQSQHKVCLFFSIYCTQLNGYLGCFLLPISTSESRCCFLQASIDLSPCRKLRFLDDAPCSGTHPLVITLNVL